MRNNHEDSQLFDPTIFMGLKFRALTKVLAGAYALDRDMPTILNLDTGGVTRVITLPPVEEGLTFIINNASAGAFNLTINNPAAATIGTVSQNEAGLAFCVGGVWYLRMVGTTT